MIDYFEKVRRQASKYSHTLEADDSRFNRSTFVKHHDGHDILRNSFAIEFDESTKPLIIVVISEHYGVRVYPKNDLEDFAQFSDARPRTLLECEAQEDRIEIEEHTLEIPEDKQNKGYGVLTTCTGRTRVWYDFDLDEEQGIGIKVSPSEIMRDEEGNYHFGSHLSVRVTSFQSWDHAQEIAEEFCKKNFDVLVKMKAQIRDSKTHDIVEVLSYAEAGFAHLDYDHPSKDTDEMA